MCEHSLQLPPIPTVALCQAHTTDMLDTTDRLCAKSAMVISRMHDPAVKALLNGELERLLPVCARLRTASWGRRTYERVKQLRRRIKAFLGRVQRLNTAIKRKRSFDIQLADITVRRPLP